jgi:hypothetical protein
MIKETWMMIEKKPIYPQRIRKIQGSFAFIEHRFLRNGFFASLDERERSLYLFFVLAADRHGLSYYGYDKICTLNGMILEDYILARDGLIDKDLIGFDGTLFQVLSLPEKTVENHGPLVSRNDMQQRDPATIRQLINQSFGGRK